MAINPENDLTKPGHKHPVFNPPSQDAEILYLPVSAEPDKKVDSEEIVPWALSAKLGVGAITAYSFGIVGYQGYLAYESLEGNDLVIANATGAIAIAGAITAGAVSLFNKLRS